MKQFKTKIISNKKVAPEHYILSFKEPQIAKNINPGQFFNIRVNNSCEPLLRRPFGVHNIDGNKIDILYKVVGKATKILSLKKAGETLDILGPLGKGFDIQASLLRQGFGRQAGIRHQASVILIAGGHGIAPLYALAKKFTVHSSQLTAFIGVRTSKHIVGDKELKRLGCKVSFATEDGSRGHKGLVTDLLIFELKAHSSKPTTLYACGPKPMLKAVAGIAHKYNVPCQVSMEEYMGCGTGICMGCIVETHSGNKLVCKDGPVFDSREIVW